MDFCAIDSSSSGLTGLCMLCIYMVLENSESISAAISPFLRRGNERTSHQDAI